jgi:hypothetical protein
MKKYVMLALASVFMVNVAIMAQQRPPQERKGERKEFKRGEGPQMSAQKRAALLAIDLGLTDAEKAKVQIFMEKQDAQREVHLAEAKKLNEERKVQFETERKVQDVELEKIIGKEKFQKLLTMRAEMKHQMKHQMKQRRCENMNDSARCEKGNSKHAQTLSK